VSRGRVSKERKDVPREKRGDRREEGEKRERRRKREKRTKSREERGERQDVYVPKATAKGAALEAILYALRILCAIAL
jgi:hypothetical protein